MQSMMRLFSNPTDLNTHARILAELLLIGGSQLEKLVHGKHPIRFEEWSEAMRSAVTGEKARPADDHLKWLWETLTSEPRISRELGSRILSRDEEWKTRDDVPVLNKGEMLGIFLKPLRAFGVPVLSVPARTEPAGMIRLLNTLKMGPGKTASRRFECRDVNATVEIAVDKAGSLDEEAALMKVQRIDVVVQRNIIMAWVRSLNHAFTVTSLRLQPHRRSHGGRIYDHIAWRKDNRWISLEDIRREVEAGKWKLPQIELSQVGNSKINKDSPR
jgi:hypothetical protein